MNNGQSNRRYLLAVYLVTVNGGSDLFLSGTYTGGHLDHGRAVVGRFCHAAAEPDGLPRPPSPSGPFWRTSDPTEKVKRTVVPSPGRLVTSSLPPSRPTQVATAAIPTPRPESSFDSSRELIPWVRRADVSSC